MTKIIFVYNADSGLMNGMFDFFHKMMKPSTYTCDLCVITHNYTGMRKAWKQYLESLPFEKEYYHKDTFLKQYSQVLPIEYPAVFLDSEPLGVRPIISALDLKDADLSGLTEMLKNRLISCKVKL